jgi:hypothetical protein
MPGYLEADKDVCLFLEILSISVGLKYSKVSKLNGDYQYPNCSPCSCQQNAQGSLSRILIQLRISGISEEAQFHCVIFLSFESASAVTLTLILTAILMTHGQHRGQV